MQEIDKSKATFTFSIFNKDDRVFRDTVYIKASGYDEAVDMLRKGGFLKNEGSENELAFTVEVPLF